VSLRDSREPIVREHMESENRHEFDVTMGHVRTPALRDRRDRRDPRRRGAVDRYFKETRAAFPDQRNELIAMHHADDAVLVEFWLRGTHEGELRGIPPTHRRSSAAAWRSSSSRRGLVCERVYFDTATILGQLGLLPGSV
jgi:predicted ester cyclase